MPEPAKISKSSAVALQGAAKFVGLVLQFFFISRCVRWLGESSYDAYIFASSCAAFIGLAELGVPGATQRYIGEAMSRSNLERVASLFRFARKAHLIFAAAALLIFAGFAALYVTAGHHSLSDPGLLLFFICGVQAAMLLIIGPANTLAAALDRFREVATFNFVQGTLTPALGLIVVYFIRTPEAVAGCTLFGSVVTTLIAYRMCGAHVLPKAPKLTRQEIKQVFGLAGKGYPSTITTTIGNNADKVMVQNAGLSNSLLHYAIAGRIPEQIYQVIMPITSTVYPELTRLASHDEAAFTRAVERNIRFTLVLALSLSVVPCAFSQCILTTWMHASFVQANPGALLVVPLMGVYRGLELVFGVMTTAYFAKGVPHYVLPFSIFNATVTVFATVPMFRWQGIAGVGAMNAFIDLAQIVPMVWMLRRFAVPHINLLSVARGFVAVLLTVGVMSVLIRQLVDPYLAVRVPTLGFFLSPIGGLACIFLLIRLKVCEVPERVAARLARLPLATQIFGLPAREAS